MPHGSLSLPARLYLLAWDTAGSAPLVRAGALAELARRGLLTDEDGIATPADLDTLTGDAALDGLLELVRESRPHGWRAWVTLHARVTVDGVVEQLTADGFLLAERKRVLGVFPVVADRTLADAGIVPELRARLRGVFEGTVPPTGEEAAVAALAVAAGLPALPADGEPQRHKERIEELTERSGAQAVVSELCAALTTAA
ncbi:GOLPH3/VPS74 family protein [Streptomyces sp. 7R007]